jgi:plastocyanin
MRRHGETSRVSQIEKLPSFVTTVERSRKLKRLLLAGIAGIALAASLLHAAPIKPARAADASPSAAASPAVVIVHTKDFAYVPEVLTIPVGTTVTFVNDDEPAHTVTAVDKSFDSGNMDKNAKWTHTFNTPGTFDYYCIYHTFMKAKVVVKPATGS